MEFASTLGDDIMSNVNESLVLNYQMLYRSKGDYELRAIISANASKIAFMSVAEISAGAGNILMAEVEAAKRILDQRARKKKAEDAAIENYRKTVSVRRKTAILNLKAAASENGQLVTAILEDEDGKTVEDFMDWEEFSDLGREELELFLNELCKEGMIEHREDGRYYLLEILTDHMLPQNIEKWAMRKACSINYDGTTKLDYEEEKYALILATVPQYKAMTVSQYTKQLEFYEEYPEWEGYKRYTKSSISFLKSSLSFYLRKLAEKGVFKTFGSGDETAYAYAFLGEEV